MPSLKSMLADANAGRSYVVTPFHVRWQELPEEEQIYSEEAIAHVARTLRREHKHERSGRFSPSSMGECDRRVLLGFAGAPQAAWDPDNVEMAEHGTWGHLRWQAEGITQGWIPADMESSQAEHWVYDEDLRTGGSMDALMTEGGIFELKTAGWSVFSKIVNVEREPKATNIFQVETYEFLGDVDTASIVYEDRSGGLFHEFRHHRTREGDNRVVKTLNRYNAHADHDDLPPMLADCEMRTGQVYRRCPFRKGCPKATSVSEFGKVT